MFNILDEQFDICEGDFSVADEESNIITSGMVLSLNSNSEVVIFKNSGIENSPFGVSADNFDETDDEVRNLPIRARRKISIYRGNMWVETDQFDGQQSYAPGNILYAGTAADGVSYGQLTTAVPEHDKTIVGTVIRYNSGRNLLECNLKI
jgi:hypothetical protein